MSALEAAYMDLRQRSAAADRAGNWREARILEALCGVADYVKRVGDHPDSAHYRADKAGDLAQSAVWVLRQSFMAYAGWPVDTDQYRAIAAASDTLETVARAVEVALWRIAPGGGALWQSDADQITEAARAVSRWAERIAAEAVPDPEGEW
ncbi:MAG: hypothetical protein ACRD2C_04220 [Acidimicrobiales bacterium]